MTHFGTAGLQPAAFYTEKVKGRSNYEDTFAGSTFLLASSTLTTAYKCVLSPATPEAVSSLHETGVSDLFDP